MTVRVVWQVSAIVISVLSTSTCHCAQLLPKGAEFRTVLEKAVVPADSVFYDRIIVSVRDAAGGRPVKGVELGAAVKLPQGRLCPSRGKAGGKTISGITDDDGRFSFLYSFDPSLTDPDEKAELPLQERIQVFCVDYGYREDLLLSVGCDIAFKEARLLPAAMSLPFERLPLSLLISDVMHPGFSPCEYPGFLASARLSVSSVTREETTLRPVALSLDEVFGGIFDELAAKDGTVASMRLLFGDDLSMEPCGSSALVVSRKGIPALVAARPGRYEVTVALEGVAGDSKPDTNKAVLSVNVTQPPDTPYLAAIGQLASVMPRSIRQDEFSLFFPVYKSDYILFGKELDNFLSAMADGLRPYAGKNAAPSASVLRNLLLSYVLCNSLEDFSQMDDQASRAFLSASRVPLASLKDRRLMTDWLDPVIYGFLSSNPATMVFIVQSESADTGADSLSTAGGADSVVQFSIDGEICGGTKGPGLSRPHPVSTERFTVFVVDSETRPKNIGVRVGRRCVQLVHYCLEDGGLLILKAPLEVDGTTWVRFTPGALGKGEVTVERKGGTSERLSSATLAVSALKTPVAGAPNIADGARFKVAPVKLRIPVTPGDAPLDKIESALFLDGVRTRLPGTIGGVYLVPLPSGAKPGLHGYELLVADSLGHWARRKASYLVAGDYVPRRRPGSWTKLTLTGTAMARSKPQQCESGSDTTVNGLRPKTSVGATGGRLGDVATGRRSDSGSNDGGRPGRGNGSAQGARDRQVRMVPGPSPVTGGSPADVGGGDTAGASGTAVAVRSIRPAPPPSELPYGAVGSGQARALAPRKDDVNSDTGVSGSDDVSDELLYGSYRSRSPATDRGPAGETTGSRVQAGENAGSAAGKSRSARVLEAKMCLAVKDGIPLGAAATFPAGTEKLNCWYRFVNDTDAPIEALVEWFYFFPARGAYHSILRSPQLLPPGAGVAFSPVSRGGGKSLPAGRYRVEIRLAGELADQLVFNVAR